MTKSDPDQYLPTSVQKSYFMLSRSTRAVLDIALGKYRPGRTDLIPVGDIARRRKPSGRLMRQQQLVARKKWAFRPKTTVAAERAEPNRIANLVPERPNQIRVSDITYVATAEGWLYLAVILDLFSRRVVGWKLDDRLEAT